MKFIIILLFIIAYSFAQQQDLTFEQWQAVHGKKFNFFERLRYRQVFLANKAEIVNHNAKSEHSYKKSLNEFSHISPTDFISSRCKTRISTNLQPFSKSATENSTVNADLPESIDYSVLMQAVENQGNCGACYAFAAIAQIEGTLKIANWSFDTSLSTQYVIDCNTYDSGCKYGWPSNVMYWLKSPLRGGNAAPSENDYPFVEATQTCNKQKPKISLDITSVHNEFINGDEYALMNLLYNFGPVAVANFASNNLYSYKSGVFYDESCELKAPSCNNVNHAVVVVGYGTDPEFGDYWKIKNSWGTSWGDSGYGLIARNRVNNCNIACYAMYTT